MSDSLRLQVIGDVLFNATLPNSALQIIYNQENDPPQDMIEIPCYFFMEASLRAYYYTITEYINDFYPPTTRNTEVLDQLTFFILLYIR